MAASPFMRALGKRSIASFIKVVLNIALVMLWVALGGVIVAALVYAATLIAIAAGAIAPTILSTEAASVHFGAVTVQTNPGYRMEWQIVIPALLAAGVAVGGSLLIVRRLRALFGAFSSGEPFSMQNAGHLRAIWLTMLVMELSRYAIFLVVLALVGAFGSPDGAKVRVEAPINIGTWGAIFILIVLAEVFREGARLKQEQELTI